MTPIGFVLLCALSAASLWILNLGFKQTREARSALRAQVATEVPSNLMSGFGSLASSPGEALGRVIRLEGQVLVSLDTKQQWWLLRGAPWSSVRCDATVIESTPLRLRVAFNAGWWDGRQNNRDTVHVDFEGPHAKRLAAFLDDGRVEKPTHRDSYEADEKATEIYRQVTEMECKREDEPINTNLVFSWIVAAILGALPAISLVEWLTHA